MSQAPIGARLSAVSERPGPPRSEESERAVLAALLLDPYCLAEVETLVGSADFFVPRHQVIFEAMQAVAAAGYAIDLRTLQSRLERDGRFEEVGGIAYLAALDLDLPDLSRVATYAQEVRKLSTARQVARTCELITSRLAKERDPEAVRDQVLAMQRLVDEATVEISGGLFADRIPAAMARLRAIKAGDLSAGIPTGFSTLDDELVGLAPGELVVIAGYAGEGKTSLVEQLEDTWLRIGLRVLHVSLEMSEEQQGDRLISRVMGRSPKELRKGQWNDAELDRAEAELTAADWPRRLVELHPKSTRIDYVVSQIRSAFRQHRFDVLVVDHLMRLRSSRSHQDRRDEVSEAAYAMKNLAQELDVPNVVPVQMNREGGRGAAQGQRPRLWNLGESVVIEQEADTILMLWRSDPANPTYRGLALEKARQGEGDFVSTINFNLRTREYRELAPVYRSAGAPPLPPTGGDAPRSRPPWEAR